MKAIVFNGDGFLFAIIDFIGNKSKSLSWTLMNADFADKKEKKSAFLCVNQRPELISDNI